MQNDLDKEIEQLPFFPIYNRVAIKRYEITETKSKIYIPPEARKGSMRMSQGLVVAVGEDAEGIKPGDKVVFGRYAGTQVKTKHGDYVTMNDEDVIGIIKGDYFDGN